MFRYGQGSNFRISQLHLQKTPSDLWQRPVKPVTPLQLLLLIAMLLFEKQGEAIVLVEYVLGETEFSTFSQEIDLSQLPETDAVHIYFEAVLDHDVLISTHYSQPETHWRHAYVSRPTNGNKLTVSYTSGDAMFKVNWENLNERK